MFHDFDHIKYNLPTTYDETSTKKQKQKSCGSWAKKKLGARMIHSMSERASQPVI